MKEKLTVAELKRLVLVKYRFWTIFFICFLPLQLINVWGGLPDFAGWDFLFGFPLFYVQWRASDGYAYFNVIVLLMDMAIIYVAIKIIMYANSQINKFKIPS